MLAAVATPDMLTPGPSWPAAIDAVAVPCPLSSTKPFGQLKLTAAHDEALSTRPAISGLVATTPVSTSAMVTPLPPDACVSIASVRPIWANHVADCPAPGKVNEDEAGGGG